MKNLHKSIFSLLFIILSMGSLYAQHWLTTDPLTTAPCISPSMAPGMDGHIYAAYQDASTGFIRLKENSGSAWLDISTSPFQSNGIISMAITGVDKYNVLFKDPNAAGKLSMALYTSGSWSVVGAPGFSSATFQSPVMAVDAVTGLIYVAYYDPNNPLLVEIKKLAGSTWSTIDHPAFSVASDNTSFGFAAKNNSLFCCYSVYEGFPPGEPYGDYLYISSFSNGNWARQRGPGSIYSTNNSYPKLVVDNAMDNLYISYLGSSVNQPATLYTATMSFSGSITNNSSIPNSLGSYPVSIYNSKLYQPDELSQNGTPISVFSLSDTARFLGDPNFAVNSDLRGMTISSSKAMVLSMQGQNLLTQYLILNQATVSQVKSVTPDGIYGLGRTINIKLATTHVVNVTGNPILQLNTGNANPGQAVYVGGSGSDTLIFQYTVMPGDNNTHVDYSSASALILNGGTITDANNNPLDLTLPNPGSSASLAGQSNVGVDGIAPSIISLIVPSNGYYKAGTVLQLTVNYSENVTVSSGTPSIKLSIGSTIRNAALISGSGSSQLVFAYTVQAGENGQLALDSVITLNSATIADQAANNASINLPVVNTNGVVVDTQNPAFNISTSAPAPYFANIGYTFNFTSTEPVTGFAASGINVTNGTVSNFVSNSAGSYSATITPSGPGTTTVRVYSGVAMDLAGNPNDASAIASLQVSDVGVFKSIAPNPVGTTMNVLFTGAPDGEMCRVVLTRVTTGQVVLDKNGVITANAAHFDVSGVPAGNYICTIYWPYNSPNKTSVNVHLQGY